jgi:hypothetical protein
MPDEALSTNKEGSDVGSENAQLFSNYSEKIRKNP